MGMFAGAADRADLADDLVDRLEEILRKVGDIHQLLNAEAKKSEGKRIDSFTADPVKVLLERATEPLRTARKHVVVEAYDQRRRAE